MVVNSLFKKLLEVSQHKEKIMNQILHVSNQLVDSGDDWDSYQKYLDIRQQYIEEINELDHQLSTLKEKVVSFIGLANWDRVRELYPKMFGEIEGCLAHISEMAQEAHKLTEQARVLAEKKCEELQQEMKNLQSSKVGMTAYKKRAKQNSGYFLDKKK